MTDNTGDDGAPSEILRFPGASSDRVDLDRVIRTSPIAFMEKTLEWMRQREAAGTPVRTVAVSLNGGPGLWVFANSSDYPELCTLLQISKELYQRKYVERCTQFQIQEEAAAARRRTSDSEGSVRTLSSNNDNQSNN